MRWERDEVCLAFQWKDHRPATIPTSIDNVNDFVMSTEMKKCLMYGSKRESNSLKQFTTIINT